LESNNSRVVMWETSLELISEHPIIGSGTGDVMQVLSDRNIRNGDILLAEKKLNSHNQYLNSWVQLGLLGLLPLIMIFVTGSISAIKNKDLFYVSIVLILGISMFFESSLERQDGVIPITLLVIIFGMIRSPRSV
jgi:O-antigen ligase